MFHYMIIMNYEYNNMIHLTFSYINNIFYYNYNYNFNINFLIILLYVKPLIL